MEKFKLRPLADNVIIKPNEVENKTAGGIIIAGSNEKPDTGTVVAVGPGKLLENGIQFPADIKVGDTVLYKKYAGTSVTVDTEQFLIITADNIIAAFRE